MSEEELICENCGDNSSSELYECVDCFNQICEICANICKNCREYLCDGCYYDHKKNCR
ncbi:MAG: hypothetical protein JSV23_09685 [Promethearchaeota archaeon]|nr:MAG: hypothetical protein JSV23_09685 [Candidatus Lokiarchaeota archaeon]